MAIYKGNTKVAGTADISGKANVSLDNLSSAGKSLAARLSMPSESHTDLTLGASGAIYTADYDGELCYTVSATNTNTAFVTVYQGTMVHQTVWFASGLTSLYPGGTIHIRAGQFGIVYGGVTGFSQLALYHKIGNEPL